MRSYRTKVNYHKYANCFGWTRWEPHIEIGSATSNYSRLSRPSWNKYCGPVTRGVKWRRYRTDGKSYSYGAAVKFRDLIGIELSGEKQYSSSHTLYYKILGTRKKKLCGNNDYPSKAGKIVERYR